ncbi:MAG: 7-cyano-7-deazaguanine synthase, partial [Rhabdochlamydiaceae bacterium]
HYAAENMKQTVVPFRNGIMISIAVGYAESIGASVVAYGNHAGDHAIYPDCRPKFFEAMFEAAYAGTFARIKLSSPFLNITKTDIVRIGVLLGVPYDLTYSCYKALGPSHCGVCGACTERKEAFRDSRVPDPTVYLE